MKADIIISNDGPIKTLKEAKEKVREINKNEILVLIRGGTYFLKETEVFSLEDSGDENRHITYKAYLGETPIFTSRIKVENFKKLEGELQGLPKCAYGNVYCAPIPNGINKVHTMYNKEERILRTKSETFSYNKKKEYKRVDSLNITHDEDYDLLYRVDFEEGQIRNYENLQDVELYMRPVPWTVNCLPIESVDEKNLVAKTAVEMTAPMSAKPEGFFVENAIDHLNEANRFCVDTNRGMIYYWPEDENDLDSIFIPSLTELIRIEGEIDYDGIDDLLVKNITFDGIHFMYSSRFSTKKGYKGKGIQHDWEMFDEATAAVRLRGCENITIRNCAFRALSSTALRLDLYAKNNIIENNIFDDIGNMGILLCGYGPGTKDVNGFNIIRNNIISRCGEVIWHGHAIFLWQSGNNTIEYNYIHDTARKAIGLCGVRVTILDNRVHEFDEASKTIRWKEIDATIDNSKDLFNRFLPYLHTKNNVIRYNEIKKALMKIGDGSALNISGAGNNNHIYHNYLHHISTHDASAVLRTDDWQQGTIMDSNVIYMSNIIGITRKNKNDIVGNLIIDVNARKGYIRFASYPNEKANYGSLICNNVFYESKSDVTYFSSGYLVSDEATLPKHCDINNNSYYCGNLDYANSHLKAMKAIGKEENGLAYKSFENYELDLLIEKLVKEHDLEIDFSKMGLRESYPYNLKLLDIKIEDDAIYDRGRNDEIETYEWW